MSKFYEAFNRTIAIVVVASLFLMGCEVPDSSGEGGAETSKASATESYFQWFVENQSGDAELAKRLSSEFARGYAIIQETGELTSVERLSRLEQEGFNAILVGPGVERFEVPARTVSFLVMDRARGCKEITYERWTSMNESGAVNFGLVGLGSEDISGVATVEKTLHIAAIELPEAGEYVEIRTNSFSPLGKVIVAFGLLTGTTGCTDSSTTTSTPTVFVPPDPDSTEETPDDKMTLGNDVNRGHIAKLAPGGELDPAFAGSVTFRWRSWVTGLNSSGSIKADVPLAGNTVDIWIAGIYNHEDKINITGIQDGTGKRPITKAKQVTGVTDANGYVIVTVELDSGVTSGGGNYFDVWGTDRETQITKKVSVDVPAMN